MFDFLKKKIGGFLDTIAKKEDELGPESAPAQNQTPEPTAIEPEREEAESESTPERQHVDPEHLQIELEKDYAPEPPRKMEVGAPVQKTEVQAIETPIQKPETEKREIPKPHTPKIEIPRVAPIQKEEPVQIRPAANKPDKQKASDEPDASSSDKSRVKLGVFGAIKSVITGEAEISEKEAEETLGNLELELLEADVDLTVAEFMKERLKSRIVGTKVKRGELQAHVNDAIRATLLDVLENEKSFDFFERVDKVAEKPAKIVFLGINGAGKTTTIAKVASILQKRGKKVVLAAADTFRAAAIEQMQVHADRLGLKLIKRDYGSDPTSVAYDAVNYARAHGADVVLIDTAGRQDTNVSLINELKKMSRVIVPDIKVYVGESIAGNAIVEQVGSFNREIGIDGVILTKLDLDAKGGTVLSINKATGVPIVLIGIGQGYDALETFDARTMVKRILG